LPRSKALFERSERASVVAGPTFRFSIEVWSTALFLLVRVRWRASNVTFGLDAGRGRRGCVEQSADQGKRAYAGGRVEAASNELSNDKPRRLEVGPPALRARFIDSNDS